MSDFRPEQPDKTKKNPREFACRVLGEDWFFAGSTPPEDPEKPAPERPATEPRPDLIAGLTAWANRDPGKRSFKVEMTSVEIIIPPRIGPPPHTIGGLHQHMKDCQEIMEHNRRLEREEPFAEARKSWTMQNATFEHSIRSELAGIAGYDRLRASCFAETGEEPDVAYIGKVMGRLCTALNLGGLDEASALPIDAALDALAPGVGRGGTRADADKNSERRTEAPAGVRVARSSGTAATSTPPRELPAEDDGQLETDDDSGGQGSDPNPIPPEHRTRPLSLTKAGRFLGITGRPKDVGKQMRRRIDSHRLLCHPQGRQSFIFDVRAFPASSYSKIKPS